MVRESEDGKVNGKVRELMAKEGLTSTKDERAFMGEFLWEDVRSKEE